MTSDASTQPSGDPAGGETADSGPSFGKVVWHDLTVPDAKGVAAFYEHVVGWTPSDHDMGDYVDYVMQDAKGSGVAGVCHARGTNANVPPQWLLYVQVPCVETAAAQARAHGGAVIDGPREMGGHKFCVVRDPAGAVLALLSA